MTDVQSHQLSKGDHVNIQNENLQPVKITLEFGDGTLVVTEIGIGQSIKIQVGSNHINIILDDPSRDWEGLKVVKE